MNNVGRRDRDLTKPDLLSWCCLKRPSMSSLLDVIAEVGTNGERREGLERRLRISTWKIERT